VDERRVQFQIEVIRVTYRIERRRRDSPTMEAFRDRARTILHELEPQAIAHPQLRERLSVARRELDEDEGGQPR
jgi:uncharacterized protein (DUF2461 family)